jgi:uncharacterized protein
MPLVKRVIIIHGSYGSPTDNWFSWLSKEVSALGIEALVPTFPTPDQQSLDTWRNSFTSETGGLSADDVLVGHSLGVAFILHLLEESPVRISGAFLVSGFLGNLGLVEFDRVNDTFVNTAFDWPQVRRNVLEVRLYNSDNDPYVPITKGEELAKLLQTPLIVLHGAGHINSEAGYQKFPLLLDDLKTLLAA